MCSSEPLEPLHDNQLARAALRPGGIATGRITSTSADGSMCGVAFWDGDKVDAPEVADRTGAVTVENESAPELE